MNIVETYVVDENRALSSYSTLMSCYCLPVK